MADKVKKAFVQACNNHGSLSVDSAEQILLNLCTKYEVDNQTLSDMGKFVQELNEDLKDINQELKFIKHPLVNREFLVFGLTFETPACQRQAHYTEDEQMYFAKLLEELVCQEDYGIPWVNVYSVFSANEALRQRPLSKGRIQELVRKWTDQGYFLEKDDQLYFGPRMLVEYASHLKLHYADFVQDCPLCGKIVLWVSAGAEDGLADVKCAKCHTKIHRDCIRTFLRRNSNCPSCKKTWNTSLA